MMTCLRRLALRGTAALALLLVGFSLGAVSSARATSGRASSSTLQAVLEAVEALASGLRPPSDGQTRLLFPAVSTFADATVLFVVNAGQGPSDTPGHSGQCTVDVFGNKPTPTLQPVPVAVGGVNGVSIDEFNLATEFLGYAIATCDFPFAHGWYQVSDAGGAASIAGHALVLPPTRAAAIVESLGQ
jgi:hypothetical protein